MPIQSLLRLIGRHNSVIDRLAMASDGKVIINTDCVAGVVGILANHRIDPYRRCCAHRLLWRSLMGAKPPAIAGGRGPY
jgi:hypothetical protein